MTSIDIPTLDYLEATVGDLAPDSEFLAQIVAAPPAQRAPNAQCTLPLPSALNESTARVAGPGSLRRRRAPTRLLLGGEQVVASDRFWTSLFQRCGFNEAVFAYFSPTEVFARIAERDSKSRLRFAIERPRGSAPRLLAVTPRTSPLVTRDGALAMVRAYSGDRLRYAEGKLVSVHTPADGPGNFRIGPDAFENRFQLELPLDGFGEPRIYVTLLRLICTNGAVGEQRAFRNQVRLGQDPLHSLDRALSCYSNADGFSAMRQRFESAQRSWASLNEVRSLETVLNRINWGGVNVGEAHRGAFDRLVGDLPGIYGVTSLEGITPKRRRLLPSRARVYDLLNYASEIATHHAPPLAASRLSAWIGGTIVDEFDLEGSANNVSDFEALFTSPLPTVRRN